ncbi:hypothetical protein [Burkholderia sp. AW49-1]
MRKSAFLCGPLLMAALVATSRAAPDQADGSRANEILSAMPLVAPANEGVPYEMYSGAVPRLLLEVPREPHILLLTANVATKSALGHYRKMIEKSLESKGTVILRGTREELLELKPNWVRVWPDAETIILTSRSGTRVEGLRTEGAGNWQAVGKIAGEQVRQARAAEAELKQMARPEGATRVRRSTDNGDGSMKAVAFDIRPRTPVEMCSAFGNSLLTAYDRPLTADEEASFSRELNRWCQSGTLSYYQVASAQHAVPKWTYTDKPKLTLVTEWALVRSEDKLVPANSKHYFWIKTTSDAAGTGFTRKLEDTAAYRNHVMYGLMDVAIHTGWGGMNLQDASKWTYPVGIDDWVNKDPDLFGCGVRTHAENCPSGISVARLFPSDTYNNNVTVSDGDALSISGVVGLAGGAHSIKSVLTINGTRSKERVASIHMMDVRTSTAQPFSRSTRWRPDIAAVWDYLQAKNASGQFGSAVPSAATINPEYDVAWQIPIEKNRGKVMKFNIVYEAGWNNCVRYWCASMQPPPDRTIPPQARVYWSDSLMVDLRSESL